MNKKISIILVIFLLILVIAGIFIFVILSRNKNESKNIPVNISLEELNKKIEESGEYDLSKMQNIDKDYAMSTFLIDESKIQDIIGKSPIINTKSSMYVVIKTDENNLQEVKMSMESYAVEYENQWSTYLPDQYELVKNREIGIKGNYVYMIISEKPEEIVNMIK